MKEAFLFAIMCLAGGANFMAAILFAAMGVEDFLHGGKTRLLPAFGETLAAVFFLVSGVILVVVESDKAGWL